MKGACPCGGVTVTLPRPPEFLNSCNCSLCFRLGGLWGYFDPAEVTVSGTTQPYTRSDLDEVWLATNFCPTCSATICWTAVRELPTPRMGVNMRLFGPEALVGLPIRYPDGANLTDDGERPPPRHAEVPFAMDHPF